MLKTLVKSQPHVNIPPFFVNFALPEIKKKNMPMCLVGACMMYVHIVFHDMQAT